MQETENEAIIGALCTPIFSYEMPVLLNTIE